MSCDERRKNSDENPLIFYDEINPTKGFEPLVGLVI